MTRMTEGEKVRLMRWTPEEGFNAEDLLECVECARKRVQKG